MRNENQARIKALSDDIASGGSPALSAVDALALIRQGLSDDTDPIPEGWHTVADLCAAWGLSEPRTNSLCLTAIKRGIAERKKFRIIAGSLPRPVWHYRFHAHPLASKAPATVAPGMPTRLAS